MGLACCLVLLARASAANGSAPPWLHALTSVPLPAHDEKTDAVQLYSETTFTVLSADKVKTHVREAYKILRPDGREYGTVRVDLDAQKKVTGLHGWCIPAADKDYEVKDKEAIDLALPMIEGSDLVSDVKERRLRIPAADPGNIIGYEYDVEERPLVLEDIWYFQEADPVREAHYSLQLPPGWEYKASFLNYPESQPVSSGGGQWQWTVSNVKGLRSEEGMPPFNGVRGQLVVSFYPPGGPGNSGYSNWQEMGNWYQNLTQGRRDPSPDIQQKVTAITASAPTQLAKMKAIADFVQRNIRYVAIELGIGGYQPHPASAVFANKYGDCKDKATLTASMLHEIGVQAFYVIINDRRGSIGPQSPAHNGFNHVIVAIKLPEDMSDPSLVAARQDPKLGRILFFDPTNEYIPFGEIGGYLQSNWGLLVTPGGGELVELPRQSPSTNGIQRTAKLTLNAAGKLSGAVNEVHLGDMAWGQREWLRVTTRDADQVKPIESLMADSLSTFRISNASVVDLQLNDKPLGFRYSFESEDYAKTAGNLLLVRPRVLGREASGILETKDPRQFSVEFDGPKKDTDTFEITLPPGYEVDDLPPPVDVDYGYADYHSKTEVAGNVIRYSRTFEVKELSVPVSKADELKNFYRIIASDERNTAVLKPSAK